VITDVSVEVIFDLSLSRCCREQAIYESSLRAGHGWRESLYRHQGCFEASDCGRLGRQAAGHPWSALRVVKSCRKDCPTASVLPKPKQQLCIQSGTREVGEAGKRSAGNRIGYQVIDRQAEDRQTGRNKADERWYPSRPCSVLNSGL
jgi:hypothetical protein